MYICTKYYTCTCTIHTCGHVPDLTGTICICNGPVLYRYRNCAVILNTYFMCVRDSHAAGYLLYLNPHGHAHKYLSIPHDNPHTDTPTPISIPSHPSHSTPPPQPPHLRMLLLYSMLHRNVWKNGWSEEMRRKEKSSLKTYYFPSPIFLFPAVPVSFCSIPKY